MIRRATAAIAVVAFVLAAGAGAGRAARSVGLGPIDTNAYPELRTTVVAPLGSPTPRVQTNGNRAAAVTASNLGRVKSIVLALDRSRSMQGSSLANATSAARAFVADKNGHDRIAVVSFGDQALSLTRFSASTIDADSALREVTSDRRAGTALYDAIVVAAGKLRTERRPGHVIVVLTDGHDVSSRATIDSAITAAHRAKAGVYAIAIAGRDFTPGPLRRLARETGGSYHQTSSSDDLRAIYGAIGRELARTWELRWVTAARPGEVVHLRVAVPGAGAANRTFALAGAGDVVARDAPSGIIPARAYGGAGGTLVIALAVALLILFACAFFFAAREGDWVRSRLDPHLGTFRKATKHRRRDQRRAVRTRFVTTVEEAFGNIRQFRRLQRMIERADLPLRAPELLGIGAGLGILLGLFAAVAAAPAVMTVLLMIGGGFAPIGFVSFKAHARLRAFENQMPDLLITLAASLKAGHSFRQGVQSLVEEAQPPASDEFKRMLTETKLGRPMDEALAEMAERVGSKNFTFVITAVTIQRQIGGSLAGLFDMIAETVRQRQQFARKVRSLTAMGRMSSYTLIGLPFFVAGVVGILNPSYMTPLFHTSTGRNLIYAGLAMMTIGSVLLKKIVSFRG